MHNSLDATENDQRALDIALFVLSGDLVTLNVSADLTPGHNHEPSSHHQSWPRRRTLNPLMWVDEADKFLNLVSPEDPGARSGFYAEHSKSSAFFLNPNPTASESSRMVTDELLGLRDMFRRCTGQGHHRVVVIINWCSISLDSRMSQKYNICFRRRNCSPNTLLNLCQGFCWSLFEISHKIWFKAVAPRFFSPPKIRRENGHTTRAC